MPKRLNGEGSIYFVKSRNKWCAAVMSNGKKISKYTETPEEATKALQDLRNKYCLIEYSGKMSLNLWCQEWLYHIKVNEVAPKTIQSYAEHVRTCIEPYAIGNMNIADIKSMDIKRHFSILAKDGISRSKFVKLKSVMHAIFKDAMDMIIKNPVEGVAIPKNAKDTKRIYSDTLNNFNAYTEEDQKKLMTELIEPDVFREATINNVILFSLGTGARLGEILPLNYEEDFNEDYTEVHITKNLQNVPIFEDKKIIRYELQELTPKTENSRRTIPLPSVLTRIIKKQILEIKKLDLSDPYFENHKLLFPDEVGCYLDRKLPSRRLKAYNKALGLPNINFHGLRHTYATRLLEAGESIQTISVLLGHYDISITMEVYTHILENQKRISAQKIENIMSLVSN